MIQAAPLEANEARLEAMHFEPLTGAPGINHAVMITMPVGASNPQVLTVPDEVVQRLEYLRAHGSKRKCHLILVAARVRRVVLVVDDDRGQRLRRRRPPAFVRCGESHPRPPWRAGQQFVDTFDGKHGDSPFAPKENKTGSLARQLDQAADWKPVGQLAKGSNISS